MFKFKLKESFKRLFDSDLNFSHQKSLMLWATKHFILCYLVFKQSIIKLFDHNRYHLGLNDI